MKETVRELISEEKLMKRIDELAEKINKDYQGKTLNLICILKGSIIFTCGACKETHDTGVKMDFMEVSSYGSDTQKLPGNVKIIKDLDAPIPGKHTMIIEDILDSGRTLSRLLSILEMSNPASLAVCTLLDKPARGNILLTWIIMVLK